MEKSQNTNNANVACQSPAKSLSNVTTIIVHAGRTSHQDERIACALAYAFGARVPIERRDPTPEELADPHILILDVGGVHDPAHLCFDHHQRGRDEAPACAYSLFAEWLCVSAELETLFPWYSTGILLDSKGPFAVAKAAGTEWSRVQGLYGPDSDWLAQEWANDPEFRTTLSATLGETIRRKLEVYGAALDAVQIDEVNGLRVMRMDKLPASASEVSDALAKAKGANVIVFNDDRGAGFGLLRVADDPRVDFSRLEGDETVVFAHKGGFIAKTTEVVKGDDARLFDLIARAIK